MKFFLNSYILDRICLREIFFLLSNELKIEPLENMYNMYVWRKGRQLHVSGDMGHILSKYGNGMA